MGNPKKHHFLPQFYLEGFKITPQKSKYAQICVIPKKKTPKSFTPSIKDTGCQSDYHTVDIDASSKDRKSLEAAFAELEGWLASEIKGVIEKNSISSKGKQALTFFISTMRLRVPSYKRYIEKLLQENVEHLTRVELRKGRLPKPPKVLQDFIKEHGDDIFKANISNWMILLQMVRTAIDPHLLSIIEKMNFSLFKAPSKEQFITCDSPVALYIPNYEARSPYGVGFSDREIEVSIPLTKKILLFASWHQKEDYQIVSPEDVIEFNRRTIIMSDKFIYSSSVFEGLIDQVSDLHNKTAGFQLSTLDYGHGFCQITRFVPVSKSA